MKKRVGLLINEHRHFLCQDMPASNFQWPGVVDGMVDDDLESISHLVTI